MYGTDYGFALEREEEGDGEERYERRYTWDERNRMTGSRDAANLVQYRYGEDGERAVKYAGKTGKETLYFSRLWQVTQVNREWRVSKHVYVGNSRLVTKNGKEGNENTEDERNGVYYYHGDHLGSAQVVTDREGKVYERYEYTPYGEVWIEWENRGVERNGTLPYRFTGKELDEETGLYYYGARYLDPRASRWLSADPAVGEYLPEAPTTEEARKRNGNLPGMGGIYNYVNLHVYHYAGNNPVKYTDPDGRWTFSLGISANITFGGGWTGSVGIAFGDSENDKGSFGFYASGGETQGTPSAGIGITGSLNLKAESVKDLNGSGEKSLGGSYAMMSVDVATDENYKPDPASGISATVGKGTPLPEGHGATTATVTASTSLSELSRKLENTRQKLIEKFVDIMVNPYDNL